MFVVDWAMLLSTMTVNLPTRLLRLAKEHLWKGEQREIEVTAKTDDRAMLDLAQLTTHIRLNVSKLFGSFNVDRIEINKPLIHQGMDSLIAVELRSWLAKEMSIYTPLVELLQGMSIHDLAVFTHKKLLERQSQTGETSSSSHIHSSVEMETDPVESNEPISRSGTSLISSLHSSSSSTPLFCIHDILGLSQTFIQLAIGLTNTYRDQCPSVFAFRASGYEAGEACLQSIERIAEEYIFQMRRLQPTGPYQLLGYSFGGLVAFEMARQLQEKHRATVRSLILIDPPVPALENVSVPEGIDEHQFWSLKMIGFIEQYAIKANDSLAQIPDSSLSNEERTQNLDHIFRALHDRFFTTKKSLNGSSEAHSMAKNMYEVIKAQTIARESYTYRMVKQATTNLQINRAILFTLKHSNQRISREMKEQTWQSLVPNLVIQQLHGTHDTLLETATASIIIEQLQARNIL